MSSKKLLEFFDKSFVISCPQMTLTQLVTNSPKVYQGSGSVTRTSSRQLELKLLYSDNVSYSSFLGEVFEDYGDKTGKIISDKSAGIGRLVPEDRYFDLNATDDQGRVWTSKRFLIDKSSQSNQITITAQLYKISHTAQVLSDENPSLRLQLSEIINIPFSVGETKEGEPTLIDHVNFTACGYEFIIRHESNGTLIEVTPNSGDLPAFIETRVCEALQFVVGVSISWSTLELKQSDQKTIAIQAESNRDSRDKQIKPLPPIRFNSIDTNEDIWNLYAKYVCHILTYPKEEFHPMSGWVGRVIDANSPIVEKRILVLSVAIEGLLEIDIFKEKLMINRAKTIKIQVSELLDKVEEMKLEKTLNDRTTNFLNSINANPIRPIDKLNELSKEGLLDKKLVSSWKKNRDDFAHGRTIEREEIKKYSILCGQLNVLFNHLIFLIIGYTGKYTDYSEEGWIKKDFNSLFDRSN